jgi:hypothetical protein
MSLRPSHSISPLACSGLMYVGVPRMNPDSVVRSFLVSVNSRAMPKSAT